MSCWTAMKVSVRGMRARELQADAMDCKILETADNATAETAARTRVAWHQAPVLVPRS